jgi:hypothetical protein
MNMVKFIYQILEVRLIALAIIIINFASIASSETIIMECNSTYYKYEKSFFGSKKVSQRIQADWKPWCDENIIITDKGARCVEEAEEDKVETNYEYSYYTQSDVNKAEKLLRTRWKFCVENVEDLSCFMGIMPSATSILNYFDSQGRGFSFDGCDFIPTNEERNFHKEPVINYLKKHKPKLGYKKCFIKENTFVTDTIKFESVTSLDFLLSSIETTKENIRYQSADFATTNEIVLIDKDECNIVK